MKKLVKNTNDTIKLELKKALKSTLSATDFKPKTPKIELKMLQDQLKF